jgi:AcrR family transcriptional regulator
MNKQESKYFNTASLFDEALIILLEQKDIEYIKVKEICERAGVNRSTFYLHYESIDDLLNETLEYVTNKFIAYFNKNSKEFIEELNTSKKEDLILIKEEYLKPYLEFIRDNKKVFIAAFRNPDVMKTQEKYSNLEKYILNPILDKYNIPDYKKKYVLQFHIHGIMAIIKDWTINDCKDKIEDIVNIIIECVKI